MGETQHVSLLHLADALAACTLSARLRSEHRQWAIQRLIQLLNAIGNDGVLETECLADLTGDMPICPATKLEGHQNRVTECFYNSKKNLLASR